MNDLDVSLTIAVYCQSTQCDPDYIAYQRYGLSKFLERYVGCSYSVEHYADDGHCTQTQVRPAFQRLLLDAANGAVHCIVVNHWSRLAATDADVQRLKRFFEKSGVLVIEYRARDGVPVRFAA